MGWVSGVLLYAVIWWLVFFMMLPIGVRAQNEGERGDDAVVPGTPASAPERPHLVRKALATTLAAALVWGLVYLLITNGILSITGEEAVSFAK